MAMTRRDFIQLVGAAAGLGLGSRLAWSDELAPERLYDIPTFGDVRLLHFTDCHAQLLPVYFREPNVNVGVGAAFGKAPHRVGSHLLETFKLAPGSAEAYAFSHLDFAEAARRFGKAGGFAHLATLVERLRAEFGGEKTLLLDGGDTWQGSATALWSRGRDMVAATNLLGVDVMTGHWEFTYNEAEVRANMAAFHGDFLAQNILVKEDALFDGAPAFDEETSHALRPYQIKTLGQRRIAVIGQAFPYTPIANPARFIPDWSFGIRREELQQLVENLRQSEKPDAVVLLSHNGMDVDLKLASEISGIDVILGGHTHDAVPSPMEIKNPGGVTVVANSGSNGKFLSVLDLSFGPQGIRDYRARLLPILSNYLAPDRAMETLINKIRAPYTAKLDEELAVAETLLYRRGNFNGTFDQIICDSLLAVGDAQIALSPGFRWEPRCYRAMPSA